MAKFVLVAVLVVGAGFLSFRIAEFSGNVERVRFSPVAERIRRAEMCLHKNRQELDEIARRVEKGASSAEVKFALENKLAGTGFVQVTRYDDAVLFVFESWHEDTYGLGRYRDPISSSDSQKPFVKRTTYVELGEGWFYIERTN